MSRTEGQQRARIWLWNWGCHEALGCHILETVPSQAEVLKGRKLTKKVFWKLCSLWSSGMCQDDTIWVGCDIMATLRFPPGHLLVPPGNLLKLGTGDLIQGRPGGRQRG